MVLSASTVQRYARDGLIPCRPTPGGRYRFDLAEVLAALDPRPAVRLTGEAVTGALSIAELPVESPAHRLHRHMRRHMRGHTSLPATATAADDEDASGASSAVPEQLANSSRRSLALT